MKSLYIGVPFAIYNGCPIQIANGFERPLHTWQKTPLPTWVLYLWPESGRATKRIRIGDLRVIFWYDEQDDLIYVDHIGPRGDIYKQ